MQQFGRRACGFLMATSLVLAGCGADAAATSDNRGAGASPDDAGAGVNGSDASAGMNASDATSQRADGSARCRAPAGVVNHPTSIAQVAELLNALPKPVTLPCFLESLARPLHLRAANSEFSAQPAAGARSPRIFLFFDPLIASVVPAGPGAQLLELGERRSPVSSLKAELLFPITEQLDAAAPYRRVAFSDSFTVCGACHQGEKLAADLALPLAYVAQALRPVASQHVPLTNLMMEPAGCDAREEPERCELLDALLGPTPAPIEGDFPSTFNTFF
jgi:hypothetical protein